MRCVYRVEHLDTHQGPFQFKHPFCLELLVRANRSGCLLSPSDDGLPMVSVPRHFVFGALSPEALKRWVLLGFSIEENERILAQLDRLGFVLAEYLVDEADLRTSASGLQTVFDAHKCHEEGLVEYRPLASLLQAAPLVFADIRYCQGMERLWSQTALAA